MNMDIDKEYEIYEASIAKKARDNFNKNEDVVSTVTGGTIYDKLARIMKFGGNMELEDAESWRSIADPDIDPDAGEPVDFKYDLFVFGIHEYLEKCGIRLPFRVCPLEKTSIIGFSWSSLFGWMNGMSDFRAQFEDVDSRFIEKVITWMREKGVDFKKGMFEEGSQRAIVLQKSHEEFWVVSGPSDFKTKPNIGEMSFLVKREDDQMSACRKYAEALIEYMRIKYGEEKFINFQKKVEDIFDYLSKSKNDACARAMNENIVHRVVDKFRNRVKISPESVVDEIDDLREKVDTIVEGLYEKKQEELGAVDPVRDAVSGLTVANAFFAHMSDMFKWRVTIVSSANRDPVYFDNELRWKNKRSNTNIENRFMSRQTYGILKRNYQMNKSGKTDINIYYAKIDPMIPIMKSDKVFFKEGFIYKKCGQKMTVDDVKDLLYKTCCYLRENLVSEEWNMFLEFLDSKEKEIA